MNGPLLVVSLKPMVYLFFSAVLTLVTKMEISSLHSRIIGVSFSSGSIKGFR